MMRRGTNQRWNFGMRGTVENGVVYVWEGREKH